LVGFGEGEERKRERRGERKRANGDTERVSF
jgi:hypothetical protein